MGLICPNGFEYVLFGEYKLGIKEETGDQVYFWGGEICFRRPIARFVSVDKFLPSPPPHLSKYRHDLIIFNSYAYICKYFFGRFWKKAQKQEKSRR